MWQIVPRKLLRQFRKRQHWPTDLKLAGGMPNCTDFAVCFSRLLVLTRRKSSLRFAQRSEPQNSRSRFHWRHARKQLTRNTAAKKLTLQEDVDSDYLFGNFLELSAFSPLNIVIMPNNPQSDSVAHELRSRCRLAPPQSRTSPIKAYGSSG
jgi:hypothetical protein